MNERTAVRDLVERMGGWLEQQPEYPFLFLADRQRRRRAASIVAKRLMTLPAVPAGTANRATRRGVQKQATKNLGRVLGGLKAKRQRQLAKALRDQRRYRRLGYQQAFDRALQEDVARDQLIAALAAEEEAE